MPISRDEIVETARTWMDTPYLHQGRRKGHGVDCLGLVAGVGIELGLTSYDNRAYKPSPDGKTMRATCDRYLVPIGTENYPEGSVALLWMATREYPQHMAIFTRLGRRVGIVHAHQQIGRVREHGFDDFWKKRLVQVYDYPGVI